MHLSLDHSLAPLLLLLFRLSKSQTLLLFRGIDNGRFGRVKFEH
jgi:hypothetical protein